MTRPATCPITGPCAINLRPYQSDAIAAIEQAEGRGIRRPLIALPTGTGKTVVFAHLISRRPGRALVLAHRDELIQQAADKIHLVAPVTPLGIVKAASDEHHAPIVVASVQTLSRPARLARLQADFATVVVDEAHHGTAETYQRILEHMGSFREDGPLTLGVTATPERGDGMGLDAVWQEIVYKGELLTMIEQGYLCDLRGVRVSLDLNLDRVHIRAGDFVASELDDALLAANAPQHAVEAYRVHAAGRKALLFTPGVALAHQVAVAFRAAAIPAEALDGKTPAEERHAILARLHRGETRLVCNCAVLTEGFDEPSIDCIILARPTKSRPFYIQMVGRGTRTWPGKDDCLILDLVGTTSRYDLQSMAALFGLRPDELADASVVEALGRRRDAEAQEEAHGRLVAQTVELFRRRPLHWVSSGPTRYALSIGDGLLLLLTEDLTRWRVEHVGRDRQRRVLANDLDLGFAQGTAEDFARKMGAGRLVDRDATWRKGPVSPGQIETLRRCRIRIAPGLSKGEASDLITAAVAGRCA
jgi:superfamily II DNA or RNA helicase